MSHTMPGASCTVPGTLGGDLCCGEPAWTCDYGHEDYCGFLLELDVYNPRLADFIAAERAHHEVREERQ